MPPVISLRSTHTDTKTLCYYVNSTNQIQLIQLWNDQKYQLEKIIFPQQRFLFGAEPEGILEVSTKQEGKQVLAAIFTCHSLKINRVPAAKVVA